MMTRTIAILFLSLIAARGAFADEPEFESEEAAKLVAEGMAEFRSGNYARAKVHFAEALEFEDRAEIVFAMGQSDRLSGDCAGAIRYFEDFVTYRVTTAQRKAAHSLIEQCSEMATAQTESPVDDAPPKSSRAENVPEVGDAVIPPSRQPHVEGVAPAVAAQEGHRRPFDDSPPQPQWTRDPLGHALLGFGVVGVGAGIWLLTRSQRVDQSNHQLFEESLERSRRQRTFAFVAFGAAGAFTAAAVIRYAVVAGRKDAAISVAITPTPTGGVAQLTTTF